MASNLDKSSDTEKKKMESDEDCDKIEVLNDNKTSCAITTKKKKNFLSSLKATPLFSSSPLTNIATNIKNSLHSSREAHVKTVSDGFNIEYKSSQLPSKQEVQELVPAASPISPIKLRGKTSSNSPTPSFKRSSTLFDPEDEEPIGPLFGVLRIDTTPESNQESEISSLTSVTSSKTQKGFLDRLRCSFGSRLSFGSKIGGRSLRECPSIGSLELPRRRNSIATFFKNSVSNASIKNNIDDPVSAERRNSISAFFRRSNPNPSNSKKNGDNVHNIRKSNYLSKSLDIARQSLTLRPISINADVDFRNIGLSAEGASYEERNPQASLSWIWQEMGEKKTDANTGSESWEPSSGELKCARTLHDSGDSGIAKSISKEQNFSSPDIIFGSIPELDNNVFFDIFKSEPQVPHSSLSSTQRNIPSDAIVDEDDKLTGPLNRKMTRNTIRTNPNINWTPPIKYEKDINFTPMINGITSVNSGGEEKQTKNNPIDDEDGINKVDQLKKKTARNQIKTNPNAHWTPVTIEKNGVKVTSI